MKFTICTVLLLFLALESNAQFACNSAPCANGATCYNSREGNTFFCLCPAGYTGVQCEISLPGTCPPNYECVNGICNSDLMGTPHCACYIGYSGVDCSIRGPETSCHLLTPCQNDGTCFTLSTDLSLYICVCTEQFTGKNCEIRATTIEDRCDPNPCKNNGNCSVDEHNPGGYYCACLQGFSGENCSLDDTLTCTYNGQTYRSQEVREYDCNLCTCSNGMWSCTEAACGGMCEYEDMIYLENDSRQEDCNTCYCLNGGWVCTTEECNENGCQYEKSDYIEIYDEDEYRWEECNVCYCLSGLWACTLDSCSNRMVINVKFGFDGDFENIADVVGAFKILLQDDISLTYDIAKDAIEQMEVTEGYDEIKVSFSLVGTQDGSVDKMLSKIQTPINDGEYTFTFNGMQYQAKKKSFSSQQIWPENTESGINSTVVLVIVCAVTGLGFIVIILGVTLYIRTANTKRRDTKYGNAKLPNRRTGLDNGDQTRLTRETTLPSNLHI